MTGGLEVLIALPLVGAIASFVLGRDERRTGIIGVGTATLTLALSVWVWVIGHGSSSFRWNSNHVWIGVLGVHWRLGVDSLSAPLVLVTALLGWCCQVALLRRAPSCGGRRGLVALTLLIEASSIGTFLALDLIVFFVFFELVLIPMWFVISGWGDPGDEAGRRAAATRFLVVTVAGSALMLIGFLLLHSSTGSFEVPALLRGGLHVSHDTQIAVAILFALGFGAKVPLWPLHFWLPDAHAKAPTVGSVLLAGVLLKLGTYGLLRFWGAQAIRHGAAEVSPYLGALGVVGIVYGALACLAQRDLKRLIAYSSIGHMGFVMLAVSTLTRQGLLAANFVNVAHAVITGLLFFVVGALKDRVDGSEFEVVGRGLYARAPKLAALFAFGAVASLGLPGLAGFWGEMLAMSSAFSPAARLPSSTYLVFMVLAGIGVVLTTGYFAMAVRRICQAVPERPSLSDVAVDEWIAWGPLVVLTIVLGIVPSLLLIGRAG